MNSSEFNNWSRRLHEHEAHSPKLPLEMACAGKLDPPPKPARFTIKPMTWLALFAFSVTFWVGVLALVS